MAYLEIYSQYARGFLPYGTSWLDMPLKIAEAITFIENNYERLKPKDAR